MTFLKLKEKKSWKWKESESRTGEKDEQVTLVKFGPQGK